MRSHIQSVWQLELLLFLKSATSALTLEQIAKSVYMSADVIETALNDFEKMGLVGFDANKTKTFFYSPSNSEIRESAEQTCQTYNAQRVQVIHFIYSTPIQSFSDAFKIRKEDG